jgi:hypothetical protein
LCLFASAAIGQSVRLPLVEGQSARGLQTGTSRAATSRSLSMETREGDGCVGVQKADELRSRKGRQVSAVDGQ